MNSGSRITTISLGGRDYLDEQSFLDFLAERGKLITEELCRRGIPHGDTEFLRGQFFEQETIKHAITTSTQTS